MQKSIIVGLLLFGRLEYKQHEIYFLGYTESTTSTSSECAQPTWIGDGFCDDATNNLDCDYDGGDCCLNPLNTVYCEICQCINGETICQGHGYSQTQCEAISCCHFWNGTCWYSVGQNQCDFATTTETHRGMIAGSLF